MGFPIRAGAEYVVDAFSSLPYFPAHMEGRTMCVRVDTEWLLSLVKSAYGLGSDWLFLYGR